MPAKLPTEEIQKLLQELVDHFDDEDREVRDRQIRKCRRLKLYWDNIFDAWWSEVAHDWRTFDQTNGGDQTDQAYYDKPMNVFRAYIESIIAALSITTPAAKCYPDNAESTLDIVTARAGDKIGQLIGRHNNVQLLWLHALYIFYTEGTVYHYGYPRAKDEYGSYEEPVQKAELELKNMIMCPICNEMTMVDEIQDVFMPEEQSGELCPNCGNQVVMEPTAPQLIPTMKVVGVDKHAKSRVCMEAYGGLYIKIANYAKTQEQTPYLIFSHETHYANAIEEYEHLHDVDWAEKLKGGQGPNDPYTQWGRLNTLYSGEYPQYIVTMRKAWFRPSAYNILKLEDAKELRKLYPRGVKVCMVNDEFAFAEPQSLDDYWTISINPMEDYLTHDPAGVNLVPGQEITNDLISLVLQTIEHGIPQTMADPGVLDFAAYRQTETVPGGVYEATPKSGKGMGDAFFNMSTATLSSEVMPFFEMIQSINQLISGALPSLFGGELSGSNTASEYSMSRAQALQRVQNTWKIFTSWWKEIQGKAIPMFINNMKSDENDVKRLPDGSFVNVAIRMSEMEGKIGKIELEASETLPATASQIKETVMKVFETQNEFLIAVLTSPENLPQLRDAIGLVDFNIPGEDQRNLQNDEILELLESEPIPGEPTPDSPDGMMPSVMVDPIYNDHQIHFERVRNWATSAWGQQTKIDNPDGYENVLLHGKMHYAILNQQMAADAEAAANADNPKKPTDENARNVNEESDVATNS